MTRIAFIWTSMVPSFSDLQYFQEVANSLSLSRASERLGISQPALSLAIKRLEHLIGAELLIRHQKVCGSIPRSGIVKSISYVKVFLVVD